MIFPFLSFHIREGELMSRSKDEFPYHIVVPAVLLTALFWDYIKPIVDVLNGKRSFSSVFSATVTGMPVNVIGTVQTIFWTIIIGFAVLLAAVIGLKLWHFFRPMKMRTIKVRLQNEMDLKPKRVQELAESFGALWEHKRYKRFFFGRIWIILRITRDKNGKFSIHYLAPVKKAAAVLKRLRTHFPDAIVDYDREYKGIPFLRDREGIAGHLKMTKPNKGYGLKSELTDRMGDILAMMPKESLLQVTFSPDSYEEIAEEGQEQVRDIMEKEHKIQEDAKKIHEMTNRYIGRSAFKVSVFLWSAKSNVKDLADEIQTQTKGDHNKLILHRYRWGIKWRNPLRWWFITPLPTRRMVMNDRELAHFLQLPNPEHPHIWEDLDITVKKKLPASTELRNGIRIGRVDDPANPNRDARLRVKTLVNHGIIAGMAGGGKDAIFNFFMEDFLEGWVKDPNWPGLTYADPHRRGILNILNLLIEMEKRGVEIPWDRVMVLAVGPSDYPAPLNILHRPEGDDVDEVAAEAVEAIMSAFAGDLSRSRVQMENAIHALLWDDQPHTIRDIGRVFKFNEGKLRRRLREKLKNPMIRDWFVNDLEPKFNPDKPQDINVDAITTRVTIFLAKRAMQRIFAQPNNVMDVAKILKDGHLVLIDRLGAPDEAFKLTAGWLTNRYYREAQKRVGGGRPHILVYNECQKFYVPRFSNIAKENRKFDLGLVLMTQEVERLDKELLSAMGTNAGFVCSVQQSIGAKVMSELMRDQFTPGQLKGLRRILNDKGEVQRIEAALWSVDGSSNIVAPPPAFILNGEATKLGSPEEKRAIQEAEEKMLELIKRYAKHKDEVDRILAGEETKKKEEPKNLDIDESSSTSSAQGGDFTPEELEKAIELVIAEQKASASMIQRQMGIGYAKAAKIIEVLEQRGIVGPMNGRKPRKVLVKNREEVKV